MAFFEEWQRATVLTLSELWAVRPMLKIALLDSVRRLMRPAPLESPEIGSGVRECDHRIARAWTRCFGRSSSSRSACPTAFCETTGRRVRREWISKRAISIGGRWRHSRDRALARNRRSRRWRAVGARSEPHVGYLPARTTACRELRRAAAGRRTFSGWSAIRLALRLPSSIWVAAAMHRGLLLVAVQRARPGRCPGGSSRCPRISRQPRRARHRQSAGQLFPAAARAVPDGLPRRHPRRIAAPSVVVPTLLLSGSPASQRLIDNLEIYYLANRDRNLFFGAADRSAGRRSGTPGDSALVDDCADGVSRVEPALRRRRSRTVFPAPSRPRLESAEGKWMGRERKRGKLDDLQPFPAGP